MAMRVRMIHKDNGLNSMGYIGWSRTMFVYGFLVPAFRGDLKTAFWLFLVDAALILITLPVGGFGGVVFNLIYSFWYNKHYTRRLLLMGFRFDPTDPNAARAYIALNMHNMMVA